MYRSLVYLLAFAATFVAAVPTTEDTSDYAPVGLEKRITHSGKATWFHPNQGNCGKWNNDNDIIAAVSSKYYFESDHCDQYIKIQANGKTVYAKVRDRCPPCATNDLDLSPAAFKQLGVPLSKGVQKVTWNFTNKQWRPRDLGERSESESESEESLE
ncbi:hypothetical protein FRC08_000003 [Ceratobasidium sp. 394]|nr:hypothetical protein FRC08_000003 [Ceratobasidium sp. 394]